MKIYTGRKSLSLSETEMSPVSLTDSVDNNVISAKNWESFGNLFRLHLINSPSAHVLNIGRERRAGLDM